MTEKCCCGCCSLTTGTTAALTFAAIEAILGTVINVELLLLITKSDVFNPFDLIINVGKLDDFDVFHGIVLAAVGLNAFWLAFSILAAMGNITQSHGRLTPWILLTYLISLFYLGVTIYFAVKFQSSYTMSEEFFKNSTPTATLSYLTLLVIYSGGGVITFFNFYLAHVVEMRGKEIDQNYSALLFYIFSHMARCSHRPGDMQNLLPDAPPSYESTCPPYLTPEIYEGTHGGRSDSSWSLSYEALKDIQTNAAIPENFMGFMSRNATLRNEVPRVTTSNNPVLP